MPLKKSNKRNRKVTGKKSQPLALQFVQDKDDAKELSLASPSCSCSKNSTDYSDEDVIGDSQQERAERYNNRRKMKKIAEDGDRQLKDAGLFEEGMSEESKQSILNMLAESRNLAIAAQRYCEEVTDSFQKDSKYEKMIESTESTEIEDGLDDDSNQLSQELFLTNTETDITDNCQNATEIKDDTNDCQEIGCTDYSTRIPPSSAEKPVLEKFALFENKRFSFGPIECPQNKTTVNNDSLLVSGGSHQSRSVNEWVNVNAEPSSNLQESTSSNSTVSRKRRYVPEQAVHIPLYAPSDVHPQKYAVVIRKYFDDYFSRLAMTQKCLPDYVKWGLPVKVGHHYTDTLDFLPPGTRQRNTRHVYCDRNSVENSQDDSDFGWETVQKKKRGQSTGGLRMNSFNTSITNEHHRLITLDDSDAKDPDYIPGKSVEIGRKGTRVFANRRGSKVPVSTNNFQVENMNNDDDDDDDRDSYDEADDENGENPMPLQNRNILSRSSMKRKLPVSKSSSGKPESRQRAGKSPTWNAEESPVNHQCSVQRIDNSTNGTSTETSGIKINFYKKNSNSDDHIKTAWLRTRSDSTKSSNGKAEVSTPKSPVFNVSETVTHPNDSVPEEKSRCPICSCVYPKEDIESHAAKCGSDEILDAEPEDSSLLRISEDKICCSKCKGVMDIEIYKSHSIICGESCKSKVL